MEKNNLYIIEINKDEYTPMIKVITDNKTKIKRTLITDDGIEIIIYCSNNFVDLIKSKNVEINPYVLKRLKKNLNYNIIL